MNRIATFFNSSVGRKLLMGLTGFFLLSFLVVHLTINLFLLKSDGGETFNAYAEFMATYPLVRPMEIALFAGFLFHLLLGGWLWFLNRRVRGRRYATNRASETSALTSRIMWISGSSVLAFLVVHVNAFFVRSRFIDHSTPMSAIVAEAFRDPWVVAFYCVALVLLGYHLKHGVQSAFQTFGLRVGRWERWIDAVAVVFWLLIPLGFAILPLTFFWLSSQGGK
jgi:succinate dehydrogenase / fumarate reductase cytochrome b subunit